MKVVKTAIARLPKPNNKAFLINTGSRNAIILQGIMSNNMQAYKLKGKVDEAGNLVITEPVKIPPGDVEVIVLQEVLTENSTVPETGFHVESSKKKVKFGVKSLNELLENAPPVPEDFDPEQAKWEYLKEKHNL